MLLCANFTPASASFCYYLIYHYYAAISAFKDKFDTEFKAQLVIGKFQLNIWFTLTLSSRL